jgi:hypothetical protein
LAKRCYFANNMRYPTIILAFLTLMSHASAQSINTEFGKNRVQYHDDFTNWWEYETENFITYWYGKARFVAQPALQIAEMDHDEIQRVLEHRINDKIEILVYVDIADLKQSNIGTEETFVSKTGETKIVGNRMFVYFDGNHQHLREKIREGIATVYLNHMLFGSNIQEIIQNALLLNIPDWYKQGLISYAVSDWNNQVENALRDIWHQNKKFQDFSKISDAYPRIAGHSFWFFIEQKFGKSVISNLLYLTKISRGTENSFEYVLNTDLKTLKKDWNRFYTQYFNQEKGRFDEKSDKYAFRLSNRKNEVVSDMKLSPDANMLAYVVNKQGKIKVFVRDLKTNAEYRLAKYGYVNVFQETDYNYPILAWRPDGKELTLVFEQRDVIKLSKFNLSSGEKKTQIIPTDFQRIYSVSYADPMNYIFSASLDGFSDLFLYKSKNRNYDRLTNDFYDDLDASFVQLDGVKGILFSSNRTSDSIQVLKLDTIMPLENFDVFFLPEGSSAVKRLTATLQSSERNPMIVSRGNIICTGDATGIENTYFIATGSSLPKPLSNYDRHLLKHTAVTGSNAYVYSFVKDGKHVVHLDTLEISGTATPSATKAGGATAIQSVIILPAEPKVSYYDIEIDDNFKFQSTFSDPPTVEPIKIKMETESVNATDFTLNFQKSLQTNKKVEPYNNTRAIAANKKFALTNVTTKLDNDILFEGLETYTGDRQQLLTAPMGFLIKAEVKDLFEDYVIEGGARIPTTFNGSEYFITFDNRKKRIDKRFALYRKSNEYNIPRDPTLPFPLRSKKTALLGMYQLKYPFDIYRSVRATFTLRNDRFGQLSTENNSFNAPVSSENRLGLKLEYIYDNTHDAALNIKYGTRYKFYLEAINAFDLKVIDGFAFDGSTGFTGILGFDARHYVPLLKRSVLAFRMAGASSMGSEKMLYYLGGVENALFPGFNQNIPVPQDIDYAYKVNVFHMRGFTNNIRNGGSFMVFNSELRIPFMQYLLGSNSGSSFIRNFQITGFFDAGLAWHGTGPFSDKNPLNTLNLESPPLIKVKVEYFRDPLVLGYGVGLRTQLFGYFVKADYAWGIETRQVQTPRIHLSFGLDF